MHNDQENFPNISEESKPLFPGAKYIFGASNGSKTLGNAEQVLMSFRQGFCGTYYWQTLFKEHKLCISQVFCLPCIFILLIAAKLALSTHLKNLIRLVKGWNLKKKTPNWKENHLPSCSIFGGSMELIFRGVSSKFSGYQRWKKKQNSHLAATCACDNGAHVAHFLACVCFFCLVLLREDPIPTLYLYQMQNALEKCRDL